MDEWAGELIAGLSLLVAVVALLKSHRAQREASAAQNRIVEIEEKREQDRARQSRRAVMRTELRRVKSGPGGAVRLCIQNTGEAEARKLVLLLDGRPALQHPTIADGELLSPVIQPRAEVSVLLAATYDKELPSNVEVIWDDDDGKEHSYRTTLAL